MDAETNRWFEHIEGLITSLTKRFEKMASGETPCKPAVDIASLDGDIRTVAGKVKTLRLLWIPLSLAVLGGILSVVIACM